MTNETIKFEEGNIYEMRFIGDSDLRVKYYCAKRTAKTVRLEVYKRPSESLTRKIKVYSGVEYIVEGNYSMAPSVKADRIVG